MASSESGQNCLVSVPFLFQLGLHTHVLPLSSHPLPPTPPTPMYSTPPQAKEANKALPKDDEVVERKEEEEIDKGFIDSSSSEDELTEKGERLSVVSLLSLLNCPSR